MRTKSLLACLFILLNISLISAQHKSLQESSLKDFADFPIGSAMSSFGYNRDTLMRDIHAHHFNSVTADNAMKMASIAREKGKYNFGPADQMVEFAEKYNQRLFGHALVWHSSMPRFLEESYNTAESLDSFMKDYIHTYVGRYKGKVDAWDVVNEAINTFGGGYRETFWYNTLGKDYIAKAFRYAHEADPDAILFYNDFNTERDTAKLHSVLEMIKDLKAQGVPISGLGYQMHLRMDIPNEVIAYALRKGAETGLQIHLSEIDIIFNKHNDSQGGGEQIVPEITDELLEKQKQKYKDLVTMYRTIVPKEQQYGMTFWGFADKNTWINGFFRIKDWPCIFDQNLEPKPAFYGMKEGLTAKIK